jgi:DnaK suppressor protein
MTRQPRVPHPIRARKQELQRQLEEQRDGILREMRARMEEVREEGDTEAGDVRDDAEAWQADVQTDLDFALLEMQRETLANIDAALGELSDGTYGRCVACSGEIATSRLRALPFAIRCRACEEAHEAQSQRGPMEGNWRHLTRRLDEAA